MGFRTRYQIILERVNRAAAKSGRSSNDIALVAVTKNISVDKIKEAQAAGLFTFGENKVQEAVPKIPQISGAVWHMIGHLQTNKVKTALPLFHLIQSVDTVRLAEKINEEAVSMGSSVNILLEVNISAEPQKHGFSPENLYSALDAIGNLEHIRVQGLMGMGPFPIDPDKTRAAFKKLKSCFLVCKGLKRPRIEMRHLSMGMSDDFEIALEEGSNMIRLGRALFA